MKHLFFILALSSFLHSQPRDTSFTIHSAADKIKKQYPNATLILPQHPNGIEVRRDLQYAAYGERTLVLDLFRSKGRSAKRPAVVMLFGGGWASGERSQNEPIAEQLALNGYVVASIEYRLSPEAKYPAAVHDAKAAVRWLRAHAKQYGVNERQIAILGFSAGGHLAALVGATNGLTAFEGIQGKPKTSSHVQAVVDIDGVLDFTSPAESAKDTIPSKPSAAARWIGATYRNAPDLWKEASPLEHVGRSAPPYCFINSSLDRFHAGREMFIDTLSKYGIYSEVHTIPGTPHPFLFFNPWYQPTCDYILGFLNRVFRRSKQ